MAVFSMAGSNPALPTYPLQRSVRLRSSASAYFNRTPASAGNRKTWTWSGWVKRGSLSSLQSLLSANFNTTGGLHYVYFNSNDTLNSYIELSAGIKTLWATNAVFRDSSAWYHVVVAFDTTQASVANMCKFYINGVLQSATISNVSAAYISQNADGWINNNTAQYLGSGQSTYAYYVDGYLEEVNFIDGQALTPSSFGAYNSYGVWSPAKYTGSYGTNGFYLNFQDNSAVTTTANIGIGADSSGNGNYWTSNNISITAGVTYDSMLDVPTLTSNTNANFCTLNPLAANTTLKPTQGNLYLGNNAANNFSCVATIGVSSGKWYWEVKPDSGFLMIGVTVLSSLPANVYPGEPNSQSLTYYSATGTKFNNGTQTAYGATFTTTDLMGIALDLDAGTITFYKNNTSQGAAFTGLSGTYFPIIGSPNGNATGYINFGQRPFEGTVPTGFKSLNTFNLPDSIVPVGAQYMAATLYTGNGATQTITNTVNGTSFQPDFVWMKSRSAVNDHILMDSVRGVTKALFSNLTNAEVTDATRLTSFNSNGFTLGTSASTNTNAATYVGWQWRASNASAVTNTAGTITSSVSANQTAGFSIVTYTGTGSAGGRVGHGLSVTPRMIIVKQRGGTTNWAVYHASLPSAFGVAGTQVVYLNASTANTQDFNVWDSNNPTSSVFSVGASTLSNASSGTYVAYCFAAVPGYSAFGSYTGNGSADGPFVYLGFRPRWFLVKRTDTAGYDWQIEDTSREPYNSSNRNVLFPDLSIAEIVDAYPTDILSNGFKIRNTGTGNNASGGTYIYAAFAENPFKNALAR